MTFPAKLRTWAPAAGFGGVLKQNELARRCPNVDRIVLMTCFNQDAKSIFREIGVVRWRRDSDAFEIRTRLGAKLLLSPNTEEHVPTSVHVDEVSVPDGLQRRGIATEALVLLCYLADKYGFILEGGPVGWSEGTWSRKFVAWISRFGFEPDPSPWLAPVHDATAFYVRRLPKAGPMPPLNLTTAPPARRLHSL